MPPKTATFVPALQRSQLEAADLLQQYFDVVAPLFHALAGRAQAEAAQPVAALMDAYPVREPGLGKVLFPQHVQEKFA